MYLGSTTLFEARMNEFLNVAKSLEIKGIGYTAQVEQSDTDTKANDFCNSDTVNIRKLKANESDEYEEKESDENEEKNDFVGFILETKNPSSDDNIYHAGRCTCNECGKSFSDRRNLRDHVQGVHLGKKYQCNFCENEFTQKSSRRKHIKAVHEKTKHFCNSCNNVFSQKDSLAQH